MKRLVLIFCLLFSVCAFAQEMDTTFVVTADGDTVGLVHKKGEYPVVPDKFLGRMKQGVAPELTPVQKSAQKAVEAESRLNETYVDSIKYYQALVDQYNSEGRIRLYLGWCGIFAGLAVMAVGNDISSSGESRTGKPSEMWANFALCGGLGISIAGFVVRSMGARRLEKAEEYTRTRDMYKRYGSRISVSVAPVVNPISKALGGNLALSF
ncbi:MAG: hypothetical protein MJZ25_14045 [Fibrobacter sp.]|nr:hypothetical protein [Fibrobacter sp.]